MPPRDTTQILYGPGTFYDARNGDPGPTFRAVGISGDDFDGIPAGRIDLDTFLAATAGRRAEKATTTDVIRLLRLYHPDEYETASRHLAGDGRTAVFQATVDSVLPGCPWRTYLAAIVEIETGCPPRPA